MAWGLWRIPERKLRLLGPTRGRRILELGCGAARWSYALRAGGADVVALDFSAERLEQARRLRPARAKPLPMVRADAERLPFADESFDIVFSDWGAMTFCDPSKTVPEVSRVLRNDGVFAFSNSSPFRSVAQNRRRGPPTRRLIYPYFGLGRLDYPGEVNFQRTYADWVRLFTDSLLRIERLVEHRPGPGETSTYLTAAGEPEWARRWPLESIWGLRKTLR